MNELQVLTNEVPDVAKCTPETPYVQLWVPSSTDSGVAADVEWVTEEGVTELRVGVTERKNGNAEVVYGVVFNPDSGELLRAGRSVSMASPIPDDLERAGAIAEMTVLLIGASAVQVSGEIKDAA